MAPYNYYDSELCAKIGKYADTSGNIRSYCEEILVKPDVLTQLQGWNTDCAVATKYNNPALLHTHGGSFVLGKKHTNSILGGNGSGEVKSYPSCRKAS